MTLDQVMAFTVNPDHARQEQVWEALQRSYTKEPHQIRRMLTEGAVRASDKRAQFVGIEAYEGAGGAILRDLFSQGLQGCKGHAARNRRRRPRPHRNEDLHRDPRCGFPRS